MEMPQELQAPAVDSAVGLGLVAPVECKKCESGKCGDSRIAHCCGHELDSFDEFHLFFFGVIFHEFSHLVAAKLAGIRVLGYRLWHPKIAWVRIQNPQRSFNDVFISFAPLLFGSIVSSLMLIFLFSLQMWNSDPLAFYFLLYLSVSIAVHSAISKVDAYSMALALGISFARRKDARSIFVRLTSLLVWPFYFLAASLYKLSVFWFMLVQYLFLVAVFALLASILFVR
jgi:hypothetical protein